MAGWVLALPVLVVLAATAVAVGITTAGNSSQPVSVVGGTARIGGPAPDFTSWDLSGKRVRLADLKARPMLLTFWATWCTACQEELPELQRIQDSHQSTGFTILAVNYREIGNARLSHYLAGLHVSLESVIDPEGKIASAYGVDIGLPVNVLLDRSGMVVQKMTGVQLSTTLENAVAQVA